LKKMASRCGYPSLDTTEDLGLFLRKIKNTDKKRFSKSVDKSG